ncbi:MAG: hypothetical protein GAK45_01225 [Pseudomonas citronellolis]|nr:MAG: hypothetical protein GAK45_01225 [Pseudomonas citronellolis]
MARQLVVCIDGTSNRFSNTPTNIVRLYRSLPKGSDEVLTYYDQGVGTFGLSETLFEWQKIPTRIAGLAFGWGMQRIVLDAYRFLMQNYQPGDRIYLFGFSRGAYAVRILAAMVHCLGLLPADQPQLLDAAWALLTTRSQAADRAQPPAGKLRYISWRFTAPKAPDFELMAQFKATFGREARVHYLGLFDTVTSTGWIYDPLIVPYTSRNPSVDIVRHAISIDERRCFFRSNLWRPKPGLPGAMWTSSRCGSPGCIRTSAAVMHRTRRSWHCCPCAGCWAKHWRRGCASMTSCVVRNSTRPMARGGTRWHRSMIR